MGANQRRRVCVAGREIALRQPFAAPATEGDECMRRLMGFLFAALLTLSVAHADTSPDADTIASL